VNPLGKGVGELPMGSTAPRRCPPTPLRGRLYTKSADGSISFIPDPRSALIPGVEFVGQGAAIPLREGGRRRACGPPSSFPRAQS
jgi:hypothetical protein